MLFRRLDREADAELLIVVAVVGGTTQVGLIEERPRQLVVIVARGVGGRPVVAGAGEEPDAIAGDRSADAAADIVQLPEIARPRSAAGAQRIGDVVALQAGAAVVG